MTLSTRGLQLAQALIHALAEGKVESEMQAEALSTAMAVLTVARSPTNASLQLAMSAVNREYRQFCEEAFSKGIVSVEQKI